MELFLAVAIKASAQSSSSVYPDVNWALTLSAAPVYLFLQGCHILHRIDPLRSDASPLLCISNLKWSLGGPDHLPTQSRGDQERSHLLELWVPESLQGFSSVGALLPCILAGLDIARAVS